jgi:membrane protein
MAAILERLPDVHVGRVDVSGIAKDTIAEVSDDDVPGLAAEMTFHALLSIFPFLLFLAGLTSIIDNVFGVGNLTDRIVNQASHVMPEDATSLLRSFTGEVVNSQGTWAIVIGLLGALWASSSAVGAAMKALNRAYDVKENRGFIKRKVVALALTVLFTGVIVVAALLLALGPLMAGGIGEALGWRQEFVTAWNWLTFPAALALVTLAVAILYALAPATDHQWRWITPGAALFVVGWVIASVVFTLYVSNFGSYNRTYGSLAAVIILLLWLYWSNMLLLIGGELNAVLARRNDPEYRAENGRKRPAAKSAAQP